MRRSAWRRSSTSLLAKVITWGAGRDEALARMRRALAECAIEGQGITTTASLHQRILDTPEFSRGEADTGFLRTVLG